LGKAEAFRCLVRAFAISTLSAAKTGAMWDGVVAAREISVADSIQMQARNCIQIHMPDTGLLVF
jgi:hypothetical protein